MQHDEIKSEMLAQNGNLETLSTVIFKSNGQELAYALSILWTLSFEKNVALAIIKNNKLISRIRILATETTSNTQIGSTIPSAAQGILWQIQGEIVYIEQHENENAVKESD